MTRALFYTTETNECRNHVRAWDSIASVPAVHMAYHHRGIRNDWQLVDAARDGGFDVVFYVGAHRAPGNPKPSAFRAVRGFAPIINLCSDAADAPWHDVLREYARQKCFDLQVAIDGARDAPVDLATLTPVDPKMFRADAARDIRCGFSGSVGRGRIATVKALSDSLTVRRRARVDGYDDHAAFLRRCRLTLNFSETGSGDRHHVKGRVLEAGWAGCALLEPADSPLSSWLPPRTYFFYRDVFDAARLIDTLDDATINESVDLMTAVLNAKYRPEMIYGEILDYVDITLT